MDVDEEKRRKKGLMQNTNNKFEWRGMKLRLH